MMSRWRGLADLVADAVHVGAIAVERVHQEVAATPFAIAALAPPLAPAARRITAWQAAAIAATYAIVRGVNGVARVVVVAAIDAVTAAPDDAPNDRMADRPSATVP
jgi:hypothetical protein